MEEEMISTMTKSEASNSNISNSLPQKPKPNSKYKGVVPQDNGNWGAQIYAKRHRTWLGTFKTKDLAAAAYDSAAVKLRYGNAADAHRNFPLNRVTIHEPAFQLHYTEDQVLNMIKDGSYQTKFYEFLSISKVNGSHSVIYDNWQNKKEGYFYKELFRKELTPSDVGKLNRLVIPKRYAVKFFNPNELDGLDLGVVQGGGDSGDFELTFFDQSMRGWKFRYCYWQSSSSFVFTRGWNNFVKVKGLNAKDIIAFYMCELRENSQGNEVVKKFYMMDIVGVNSSEVNEDFPSRKRDVDVDEDEDVKDDDKLQTRRGKIQELTIENKSEGLRLFGVQIIPANAKTNG